MAWQTDDANVMSHILAAELCAESNLVALLKELLLEGDVAEGTASLVTSSRQAVVVMCRSELDSEEVLLCRSTADNDSDVIRRTSGSSEALHLLNEEWDECARVLDTCLGLLIEVCLVG